MARIVNIRFKCCGYNFDAAVDCDWFLHCYELFGDMDRNNVTPIELYCIDKPDWDIRVIYQKNRNDQNGKYGHTVVDWSNLIAEARKWVRQMKKKKV